MCAINWEDTVFFLACCLICWCIYHLLLVSHWNSTTVYLLQFSKYNDQWISKKTNNYVEDCLWAKSNAQPCLKVYSLACTKKINNVDQNLSNFWLVHRLSNWLAACLAFFYFLYLISKEYCFPSDYVFALV